MEPEPSWILVRFLSTEPQSELLMFPFSNPKFSHQEIASDHSRRAGSGKRSINVGNNYYYFSSPTAIPGIFTSGSFSKFFCSTNMFIFPFFFFLGGGHIWSSLARTEQSCSCHLHSSCGNTGSLTHCAGQVALILMRHSRNSHKCLFLVLKTSPLILSVPKIL